MAVSKPVLNTQGSGKSVEFGNGSRAEIAVGGPESGGEYAVVRYHVVSGDEPPLHTHSREDEMVFVLEGELTAFVGDARVYEGGAHHPRRRGSAPQRTPRPHHGCEERKGDERLEVWPRPLQ